METPTSQASADRLLTVTQIMQRTGYSKSFLLKRLGRELPTIFIGRTIRVRESDLERWLECHRVGGPS